MDIAAQFNMLQKNNQILKYSKIKYKEDTLFIRCGTDLLLMVKLLLKDI